MTLLRPALLFALGVLLLTPQAAAGGGWWSWPNLDRSTVAPGQRVEVNDSVFFSSSAAAEEAEETGHFYVYLLRGFDYSILEPAMSTDPPPANWWSLGDAAAIQVGQVDVRFSDAQSARASAAFTMPELTPGTYHLMLCNAGCAQPLADVIPASDFTVVADPVTANLAERVDRLERQNWRQARELRGARRHAETMRAEAQSASAELGQLTARVSSLAAEAERSPPMAPWAYVGWVVAGAGVLVGALALFVIRRRRSRRSPPAPLAGWQPSDEELRELLSSGPAHRR
jgi:hypothetical protein